MLLPWKKDKTKKMTLPTDVVTDAEPVEHQPGIMGPIPHKQDIEVATEVVDMDSLNEIAQRKMELIDGESGNFSGASRWTAYMDPTMNRVKIKKTEVAEEPDEKKNFESPNRGYTKDSYSDEQVSGSSVVPSDVRFSNPPDGIYSKCSYPVSSSDLDYKLTRKDYVDCPRELIVPHADIFLITSSKNEDFGRRLKELMEEVPFKVNPYEEESEMEKCRVYIKDDMYHKDSIFDCIAEAQAKCTYVFVLLTKDFHNDKMAHFQKDDTLVRSITTEDRRWGIVPLYTQPKKGGQKESEYSIPNGLLSFKGLDMSRLLKGAENLDHVDHLNDGDCYFRRGLVAMLEARIDERLAREEDRLERLEEWKIKKRNQIRTEKLTRENMRRVRHNRDEKQLEQDLMNLPKELPLQPSKPVDEDIQREFAHSQQSVHMPSQQPMNSSPCHRPGNRAPQPQNPSQPMQPNTGMPLTLEQMMQFWQMMHHMQPQNQPSLLPNQGAYFPTPSSATSFPSQPPGYVPGPRGYVPGPPGYVPGPAGYAPNNVQPQHGATPSGPYAFQSQPVGPAAYGTQHAPVPAPSTQDPTPPVHNYYIQAGGNVQVGAQATMVSQEPAAVGGYEDDADALERKYNPEKTLDDWYAEPPRHAPEKTSNNFSYKSSSNPLSQPMRDIKTEKGIERRSPVETVSPQIPEELPGRNLASDNGGSWSSSSTSCPSIQDCTPTGSRICSGKGKYYSRNAPSELIPSQRRAQECKEPIPAPIKERSGKYYSRNAPMESYPSPRQPREGLVPMQVNVPAKGPSENEDCSQVNPTKDYNEQLASKFGIEIRPVSHEETFSSIRSSDDETIEKQPHSGRSQDNSSPAFFQKRL